MASLSLETVQQWVTEFDAHLGASVTRFRFLRDPHCVCIYTSEGHEVDWDTRIGTAYGIRYRWPRAAEEEPRPISQDEAEEIARAYVAQHYPQFYTRPLELEIIDRIDSFQVTLWEFCPENGARTNSATFVDVRKREGRIFCVNHCPKLLPDAARTQPAISADQAVTIARQAVSVASEIVAEPRLAWVVPEVRQEPRDYHPYPAHDRLSWHVELRRRAQRWKAVTLDAMSGEVLSVTSVPTAGIDQLGECPSATNQTAEAG